MFFAENLPVNLKSLFKERLGLCIVAGRPVKLGQVIETSRRLRILRTQYLLTNSQGTLVEGLGYFLLSELAQARGPLGLPIERDLHFQPTRLAAVRQLHQ